MTKEKKEKGNQDKDKKMIGADLMVDSLIEQGVDVTFGYPGGTVIPLFDSYLKRKGKIKNILVRHEQGAAHAAEGYARASGKVGVCVATSGPGATNLVTGIMDAYMDNVPMVAIGGQVPSSLLGNDAFQECDMIGITMPITKHNYQVRDPNQIRKIIARSFRLTKEGRPGPVYIDLPKDAQSNVVTKVEKADTNIEGFKPNIKPNLIQIKKVVEAIKDSKRPLILAGHGVILSEASEDLTEFVKKTKIPVATTLQGKGAFDEYDELSMGCVGMHGNKVANYAQINTDLVISIGCRFSDRITGSLKSYMEVAKVIHIDIDPAEIGKNVKVTIPLVCDAKHALVALNKELGNKNLSGNKEWLEKLSKIKHTCDNCRFDLDSKDDKIHPRMIIEAINKISKPDDIVVTGVGQHQMFAMHYLKRSKPRTFISSGGAGTMGFGFPAAIGAKVAKPKNEVFLLDGDGCFQMTIQELGTIANNDIKIIVLLFNNNYLGMVRQWLEIFSDKRYAEVHLGKNPDFVKIAHAYGLNGIDVENKNTLDEAIKKAIESDKTTIINIKVEEESNILPMLPPGGHIKDAFGGCMYEPGKFHD